MKQRKLGFMVRIMVGLIRLYQFSLSPDHSWVRHLFGGCYCKFQPSCSEYMRQSLIKDGMLKGLKKGILRILKCRPGTKGGYDAP